MPEETRESPGQPSPESSEGSQPPTSPTATEEPTSQGEEQQEHQATTDNGGESANNGRPSDLEHANHVETGKESDDEVDDQEPQGAEGGDRERSPQVIRSNYQTVVDENMWANTNLPVEIRDDQYYYDWMEDILEAFPNKGPPYSPTRLTTSLYIGSLSNSEDTNLLKRIGITHVLNIAGTRRFDLEKSPYPDDVGIKRYLMIPAEDVETYDILRHFTKAFAFIDNCNQANGRCLVHCNLGVNRSGAICAGYLIHHMKKPLLQVVDLLKKARQVILCNSGFRYQLITYARKRNLLDPVYQQNGYPLTLPPPTGHSKFSRNAVSKTPKNGPTSKRSMSFTPRDGTGTATSGSSSKYKARDELHMNGTANFVHRPRIPPLDLDTLSLSYEVPRKSKRRVTDWVDPEINDIFDQNLVNYDSDGSLDDYEWSSLPRSFSPRKRLSGGASTYGRPSPVSSHISSSLSPRNVIPLSPDQRSPAITIGGKSIMSRMASDTAKSLVTDVLKRSTYDDLYTPSSLTGILQPPIPIRPYNTISSSRDGGLSFNVPNPPFGTSRRRFGPTKNVSTYYY